MNSFVYLLHTNRIALNNYKCFVDVKKLPMSTYTSKDFTVKLHASRFLESGDCLIIEALLYQKDAFIENPDFADKKILSVLQKAIENYIQVVNMEQIPMWKLKPIQSENVKIENNSVWMKVIDCTAQKSNPISKKDIENCIEIVPLVVNATVNITDLLFINRELKLLTELTI